MTENEKKSIADNIERKLLRYKRKVKFDTLSETEQALVDKMLNMFSGTLAQEYKDRNIKDLHVAAMNKELEEHIQLLNENNLKMSHQSRLAGIGEMAANLSHEINNPLMSVNLLVEKIKLLNLKPMECEKRNEQIIKTCDDINNVVEKVSVIIRGLSRISNQNQDIPTQDHSLKKLYEDTESFCVETLKNKKINYTSQVFDKDILINVQEVHFSQVILNLLTNAQQAVKDLVEKERWINVSYFIEEGKIKLIFKNGGSQIKEEIQERIFEPFFTTKQVGEGTGLGLQLCKKIIEDFNGSIYLDKKANNPTFVIELPCK